MINVPNIAIGYLTLENAVQMGLGVKTVKTYIISHLDKLQCKNAQT